MTDKNKSQQSPLTLFRRHVETTHLLRLRIYRLHLTLDGFGGTGPFKRSNRRIEHLGPYGPRSSQVQFKLYNSALQEENALVNGQLDTADVQIYNPICPPPGFGVACFGFPPTTDIATTPSVPKFEFYGITFNQVASTWTDWGCNFQSSTSSCGIEIREAIAHLVDRDQFVNTYLRGQAQPVSDPVSPAQDPPGSLLATQCSWETIPADRNCINAFNLAPDPGGFAQPGSPDFCAAVAHLVGAGIGLTNSNNSCAIDSNSPGLANVRAHPIRFVVRTGDRVRLTLALGLISALDQVFGATAAVPTCRVGGIACIINTVFTCCSPATPTDDWDMYTYGYTQLNPFADHLNNLFASSQASNLCGGVLNTQPSNYGFICIPSFDTAALAALQASDPTVFRTDTLAALNEFGKHAANIPIYTTTITSTLLRDMAGGVNQQGVGISNFWSPLNGRRDTSYTPMNPIYTFGNTLRSGQSQGTYELNVFSATSPTETGILGEVYDTLFRASPVEPGKILCWMCNNYNEFVDSKGDTHFLVELRQSLRWQDGVPVDPYDVKFSLLSLRDYSYAFSVSAVLTVNIVSSTSLEIVMQGQTISNLFNLSTVPIIPRHIWELPGDTTYGDVGQPNPAKVDPSYDPITSGTFLGSGPFVCRSLFPDDIGKIGTGCAQDMNRNRIGQQVDPSGSITLQLYDITSQAGNVDPFLQYMRSFNTAWGTGSGTAAFSGQFQEFSWADRYDNATVTIVDLNSVANCYGKSSPSGCVDYPYWLRPAFHPSTPNTITTELAIVASHYGDTWVYPFSWNGVQSQQPGQTLQNITPFTP
jgi:ABC-type transport system substrate-binding protein